MVDDHAPEFQHALGAPSAHSETPEPKSALKGEVDEPNRPPAPEEVRRESVPSPSSTEGRLQDRLKGLVAKHELSAARADLPEGPREVPSKDGLSEVRKSLPRRALNAFNSARHSAADVIRANPIKTAVAGTAVGVAAGAGFAEGSKGDDE
jgi:hypothetical protein